MAQIYPMVTSCAHDSSAPQRCCQLCGEQSLKPFSIPGSSTLWLCLQCELYQYGQVADDSDYEGAYHAGYERDRARKVRTAEVRLNRVAGVCDIASPRLLEIGCSVGCTLEAAYNRGWRAVGVDVSQDAVDTCLNRGYFSRKVEQLELPFRDSTFDIVAAWHVIEHVEDVRQTLAEWKRVLKPSGLLVLETPDASCPKVRRRGTSYRRFWAREHTYTFTPRNLGQFMTEQGLELVQVPKLGNLSPHPVSKKIYAAAYRALQGIRSTVGIEKAFFIIGRKQDQQSCASETLRFVA